jgi:hypothetical protein
VRCLILWRKSEAEHDLIIMTIRTLITAAMLISGVSTAAAGTFAFSNTNAIVINDSQTPPTIASPYPSPITVSNITGSYVTKVTVQIFGFAHGFPSDVSILLVGPQGQNSILMAQVGGSARTPVTNVDLTFDDDASSNLPLESQLVSGTFKPTTNTFSFSYPPPAPSTNEIMGAFLGNFTSVEPNGVWNLFVVDQYPTDSGVITGGWSLNITTTPLALSIARSQTNAVLSWTNAATGYTLQATPTLSPPAWTNVTIAPVMVSGNYVVTNSMTNKTLFYRLTQ